MNRSATAEWKGGLKNGSGHISTESGVLSNTQYSFTARFEEGKGTNPEELIAAAHAGCFTMALSGALEKEGFTAEKLNTSATVTLEKSDAGFSIPTIHLAVSARIPNTDQATFEKIAYAAKVGCPVSKLFNANITLDAKLEK